MRVSPVMLSNPRLTRYKYANNPSTKNNTPPKNVLNNAQNVNFGIAGGVVVALVLLAGAAIDIGVMAALSEGEIFDLFTSDKKCNSNSFKGSREKEAQEIKNQIKHDTVEISKKMKVSTEEAQKRLSNAVSLGIIEPSKDGNEKGLNAVMGYGLEKYRLMTDFISPLMLAQKSKSYSLRTRLPNGILLYGPPGSGKTYMAEKLCEHLKMLGVRVKDIELDASNHEANVKSINKAFKDASTYFKQSGRYTVINFKRDMDNFFKDRNVSQDYQMEVATLMHCAEDSADNSGAIIIATANNPKNIDKALIRPGRMDIKMPIGNMKDFAIGDMIKFSLIKYGEKESAEEFDYEKVVNYVLDNGYDFTPSEYERDFVKQAVNRKEEDKLVTADSVIAEIESYAKSGLMTLDDDTKEKFSKDQEYINEVDEADKEAENN